MIRRQWSGAKPLLALLVALPVLCSAQAPTATSTSGPVQGLVVNGINVFRGLPFAAPPVGAMRWREPQTAERWTAVRQATATGPSCIQKPGMSLENGGDPGSLDEDCLYLNVFSPRVERAARLPVMVWIHGGALSFGSGGLPIYDGSALARRDVVVVTMNYRLGALGLFAHPALDRETPGGPVNFGLLDQIAALHWVRENIAAFGGDPAQVTVFGQSAGAQSVLALMASPLASGLFQGAIAESPYGLPSHTRTKARDVGVAIATALGLPGAEASLEQLRQLPAERLATMEGQLLSLAPGFIVGDSAVPQPVLQAFQQGREAAVPLVIGSNSDDASVVLAFGIRPADITAQMGRARVLVRPLYPGMRDDAQLGRELTRDAVFTAFARRIAYVHSQRAPTWRYYFSHRPAAALGAAGAAHGAEVPYVFGTLAQCGCIGAPVSKTEQDIAQRVGDRWVAFARSGIPEGNLAWPIDNRVRGSVLEIGVDDKSRPGFMAERLNALIVGLKIAERKGSGPGPAQMR